MSHGVGPTVITNFTTKPYRFGKRMRKERYTLSNKDSKPDTASVSTSTTPSSAQAHGGPTLMDRIIGDQNSLDRFLDRDPHSHPLTDADLLELIRTERARRTEWNIKIEKAKAKKQGVEE
jgi:hypothetical protein